MSDWRTTPAQRLAADPLASVFVAASAGTGKTQVLTQRVLRLLLNGTAPGRLLCLTFTKAAAAEMANRLNATLAEWTTLADDALEQRLAALDGDGKMATARLDRARQLFATVLDAPTGLRIQTLHAFCQAVLARFPLEAGVPPGAEVIDERTAAALLAEAQAAVIEQVRRDNGSALARAFARIAERVEDRGFAELLQALMRDRRKLVRLLVAGADRAVADLRRRLGLADGEHAAGILVQGQADGDWPSQIGRAHV